MWNILTSFYIVSAQPPSCTNYCSSITFSICLEFIFILSRPRWLPCTHLRHILEAFPSSWDHCAPNWLILWVLNESVLLFESFVSIISTRTWIFLDRIHKHREKGCIRSHWVCSSSSINWFRIHTVASWPRNLSIDWGIFFQEYLSKTFIQ